MITQAESLLGQTIAGYRLLKILGKGGMGIVFLAQPLDNPQEYVAIKLLVPDATPEKRVSFRARFLREVQAAYQMHHEHILPVLGYGEVHDLFYMIMPVIAGGTLSSLLESKQEPLPLTEIAGYLNQLASAIDYANQHGVVHRDIKPSNVLIDAQGSLYLTDFGIVHLFDSGTYALDQAPTALTTVGVLYGTPAYMAPERFNGEPAQPATDIYALGVMLYRLVTGQLPFIANNPLAVGMKHLNEMPPAPRSLRPDLPEPAEAAILRALAKQPADRFTSASALASAFEVGLKGQWTEELLSPPSSPVVAPKLSDSGAEQPVLVPVAEPSFQAHPLVLTPISANEEALTAFGPTQASAPPVVRPQARSRDHFRMLLIGTSLAIIVVLALLVLLGVQLLNSQFSPSLQAHPTSTSGVPAKTIITPTPFPGTTPTRAPQPTPTHAATPTPSPGTTPTPSPTPMVTPTPTPTPGVTPTPSPTPPVAPTPTP